MTHQQIEQEKEACCEICKCCPDYPSQEGHGGYCHNKQCSCHTDINKQFLEVVNESQTAVNLANRDDIASTPHQQIEQEKEREAFKQKFGEPEADYNIVTGSETCDDISDYWLSRMQAREKEVREEIAKMIELKIQPEPDSLENYIASQFSVEHNHALKVAATIARQYEK